MVTIVAGGLDTLVSFYYNTDLALRNGISIGDVVDDRQSVLGPWLTSSDNSDYIYTLERQGPTSGQFTWHLTQYLTNV